MKRSILTTIIAFFAVLLLVVVCILVLPRQSAAQTPCPPGQVCTIIPPGPGLISDGTPAADEALWQIKHALARGGCQLTYQVRVNGDGTTTPQILVQQVQLKVPPYTISPD
jgi:hypothetical protein